MILAGIDEAGYGPLLGPLVVGCCAFELADVDATAPLPCLWKRLRKQVSKNRSRTKKKLHVNDSKQVYSPSAGIKELERAILTLAHCSDCGRDSLEDFISAVASHALADLPDYPWYAAVGEFPLANDALSIKLFANALRGEMHATQTKCVHFAARIVLERRLNQMIAATHNKATVLFSTAAIHLDHLLRTFGHAGLVIICDRQGGRGHYGSLLRTMFEEWSLEIIHEAEGRAEYKLRRDGNVVRIIFTEKAEAGCMSVAVASMLSKYLREVLMDRFNGFWKTHLPELTPTAGYFTDGERFLRDIASKKNELGIGDGELIRCR